MKIAFTQHVGLLKKKQEDCLWVNNQIIQTLDHPVEIYQTQAHFCVALADGVSSSPFAALASRELVKTIEPLLKSNGFRPWNLKEAQKLLAKRYKRTTAQGAATTALVASIQDDRIEFSQCGNARAYQINDSGTMTQKTTDQTYLESIASEGLTSPDQDYATCYNALTSCLVFDDSDEEYCRIDLSESDIAPGDWFLLCTDGVHDVIKEALCQITSSKKTAEERAADIRTEVLRRGADDNFSLIVIDPWA